MMHHPSTVSREATFTSLAQESFTTVVSISIITTSIFVTVTKSNPQSYANTTLSAFDTTASVPGITVTTTKSYFESPAFGCTISSPTLTVTTTKTEPIASTIMSGLAPSSFATRFVHPSYVIPAFLFVAFVVPQVLV